MNGFGKELAIFVACFLALLFLLIGTVCFSFMNLGGFNTPLAFFIALLKAGIIVAFFMELREGFAVVRLFALAGVVTLLIGFALLFVDYTSRGWPG